MVFCFSLFVGAPFTETFLFLSSIFRCTMDMMQEAWCSQTDWEPWWRKAFKTLSEFWLKGKKEKCPKVPLLLLSLFEKILAQFENTTLSKRHLHCGIQRQCCQPERVKDGLWQTKTFKQSIQTEQAVCSVFRSSYDSMKITAWAVSQHSFFF